MIKAALLLSVILGFAALSKGVQSDPQGRSDPSTDAWMKSAWTGSDRPFLTIESNIDSRITHGEQPGTISQEYEPQAQSHPLDPKSQFAWAYAEYRSQPNMVDFPVLEALKRADPGNVYEYTRLRFVITRVASPNNDHMELRPLGYRLLRHTPNDELVEKNLVYVLSSSTKGLPEALAFATKWVKQDPESAGSHAVLASVYQEMWNRSRGRNKSYVNNAVAEYQQYLRLATPTDHFRRQAQTLVQLLPQEKPW